MAEKWLTLLVHGVGDTEPGHMIESVVPVVEEVNPDLRARPWYEVWYLPEPGGAGERFPLFTRRAATADGEAVFAEVFWADLSRVREGTFDLLVAVFRLVFGLRYVADQAAAQGGALPAVLRGLLYLSVLLFRGPFLALFALGGAFCLLLGLGRALRAWDWPVDWTAGRGAVGAFVCVGLAAVAAGLGLLGRGRRNRFRFGGLALWLVAAGLGAVGLAIRTHFPAEFRFFGYLNRLHDGYLDRPDSAAFYIAVILWLTDWVRDAAFVLLAFALGALVVACAPSKPAARPGLVVAYLAGVLQSVLWLLVLAPLDFGLVGGLDAVEPRLPADIFQKDLSGVLPYVGFLLFLVYALLTAGLVTWAARSLWSRTHGAGSWPRSAPPRLIVGVAVRGLLLLSGLVLCQIALYGAVGELEESDAVPASVQALAAVLGRLDRASASVSFAVAVPVWLVTLALGCALVVYARVPRNVLHIVMDIVIHFSRPREGFPLRRRIEARFRAVLGKLLDEMKPTHVTVLAHSQGTVIALNVLAEAHWGLRLRRAGGPVEVNLVTLGSPFTHLYQHYFPSQYPGLNTARWAALPGHVDSWFNVFRVDDYVGTHIDGGTGALRKQTWPVNVPADGGGHTRYWRADVVRRIAHLLPGRRSPQPVPGPEEFDPVYGLPVRAVEEWLARNPQLRPARK